MKDNWEVFTGLGWAGCFDSKCGEITKWEANRKQNRKLLDSSLQSSTVDFVDICRGSVS